jgi:hypothetical protein
MLVSVIPLDDGATIVLLRFDSEDADEHTIVAQKIAVLHWIPATTRLGPILPVARRRILRDVTDVLSHAAKLAP